MDPLSVASGVAGLVTLADVVISRTYNTIIACKHASEDSRRLLREVQALLGILQSLSSLESKLGAAALQSHIPAAQILSCQQTLQNIRDKLEKSDPKENGISVFQKAKRTLKWPLSASDTEKFLAEMERHRSTFDLALSVDALDAILSSREANGKTEAKIDHVVQTLDRLCKIENTKEQRRILQLIGAGDADEAYRANLKLHQHGTGLWFLEEGKPFSTWLATPSSKLWVYGIPGAGKTILSALAISKIAKSTSTTHGLAFYYCSHRNKQSRELAGILACLVGQLARQNLYCMSLLEGLRELHEHTPAQGWMRNDDELDVMLRKMVRHFSSVSIVIDGVDECHESTVVTDTLASLARDNLGVRIVIFSRKEAEMEPLLESYTEVSIAAESEDLRLYVPAQIEARTRLRKLRIKDPNVKDEIIETLVNGADGMLVKARGIWVPGCH
jgi:hypothetical protein